MLKPIGLKDIDVARYPDYKLSSHFDIGDLVLIKGYKHSWSYAHVLIPDHKIVGKIGKVTKVNLYSTKVQVEVLGCENGILSNYFEWSVDIDLVEKVFSV